MAITKPVKRDETNFIAGAPDAGPKRVKKGSKVQISLTIAEPTLNEVDALAARAGLSRAGLINLAIRRQIEAGI